MSATPARKAIIIGAGVGGLSAAIGLQRAGLEVVVLERHADPRIIESGGAFILWNNAMKALARLELADDVAARRRVPRCRRMADAERADARLVADRRCRPGRRRSCRWGAAHRSPVDAGPGSWS